MQDSDNSITIICGLDEAGRGPLAGPVSASAVILPEDFPFEILNDSKKLSEKKRLYAEEIIKEKALWDVTFIDEKEIDKINILNASLKAMSESFTKIFEKLPDWLSQHSYNNNKKNQITVSVIADGNKVPPIFAEELSNNPYGIKVNCRSIVKADAKVFQVMAASILAKTARDRFMLEMDKLYPEYGYAKHKGYPTPEHKKICRQIGPSPIQRHSFKY